MLERHEVCCDIFHGFDWRAWTTRHRSAQRLSLLPAAQEHVLAQDGRQPGSLPPSGDGPIARLFALAVPHDEAIRIRDDVGFFQAVRAAIAKTSDRTTARPPVISITPSGRSISRAVVLR